MGDFNRNNRSGEGRGFGRRRFDRGGSDRSQMHKATCSRCGKECEVPFKPTGSKPVFCNDCFRDNGGSDSGRHGGRNSGRSYPEDRRMYEAVCDNCGDNCKIPFQPRDGKPVYCSNCFGNKNDKGGRNTDQYKEQFITLHAKLDKILKMLTPAVPTETAQEEKVVKEIKNPKPDKRTSKIAKEKSAVKKTTSTKTE